MFKDYFQDFYPEELSYCYGCGRSNTDGLHVKSYWDGELSICNFTPSDHHIAIPGYVYGGLLASIIDCHGTGTASAALCRHQNRKMGSHPNPRFVTASLKVNYLKPTPLGKQLTLVGKVKQITERKVIVGIDVRIENEKFVEGEVVAVLIKELPDSKK